MYKPCGGGKVHDGKHNIKHFILRVFPSALVCKYRVKTIVILYTPYEFYVGLLYFIRLAVISLPIKPEYTF